MVNAFCINSNFFCFINNISIIYLAYSEYNCLDSFYCIFYNTSWIWNYTFFKLICRLNVILILKTY